MKDKLVLLAKLQINMINADETLENITQIIGLRNRIIHAYDSIDDTVIWAIIIKHLPSLKKEV